MQPTHVLPVISLDVNITIQVLLSCFISMCQMCGAFLVYQQKLCWGSLSGLVFLPNRHGFMLSGCWGFGTKLPISRSLGHLFFPSAYLKWTCPSFPGRGNCGSLLYLLEHLECYLLVKCGIASESELQANCLRYFPRITFVYWLNIRWINAVWFGTSWNIPHLRTCILKLCHCRSHSLPFGSKDPLIKRHTN